MTYHAPTSEVTHADDAAACLGAMRRPLKTKPARGDGAYIGGGGLAHRRIDWRYVGDQALTIAVPVVFVLAAFWRIRFFATYPWILGVDSRLYYHATATWLAGGDPWSVRELGVFFAAPPPALLLSLPLQLVGPDFAAFFWPFAGLLGMIAAIRHYRLPIWWILFPPFLEGVLPGSADPALLGAVILGAGSLAAVTKPYAVPGMLAERRYRAVAVGVLILFATFAVLPWGTFFARLPSISASLASQTLAQPTPAALVVTVAIALVSLRQRGLSLLTPALWPSPQPHYALFSLDVIRTSRVLAIGFAIPGATPIVILLYAFIRRRQISAPDG